MKRIQWKRLILSVLGSLAITVCLFGLIILSFTYKIVAGVSIGVVMFAMIYGLVYIIFIGPRGGLTK